MGGNKSTPQPEFLPEWRETKWNDKLTLLKSVKEYHPQNEDIKHLRILLYGPVGAGKSSFINSVNNNFQGRMTQDADVDNAASGSSYTITKKTIQIQKEKAQNFYPLVFDDIMGLEDTDRGIHADDIKLIMKGHVKDGYTFNIAKAIADTDPTFYNPDPTAEDKTHALVVVIPADQVPVLRQEVIAKIRCIRIAARDMGIPQICILTMIDKTSALVKKDIKNVYKMKFIKEKMEEFSNKSGIPVNCIFPLKNYHEEIALSNDIDVLILTALQHMINVGEDFINKMPLE